MEDFRAGVLAIGGKVVERPGGLLAIIEGSNSRGRGDEKGLKDSDCKWFRSGGRPYEWLDNGRLPSCSDIYSYPFLRWLFQIFY